MNELIQKPWFFTVSIVTVLLCSLGTWSALHGGKPFVSGMQNGSQGGDMNEMRGSRQYGSGGERGFGSGMQRNFSGENRMGSGSLGSGMQGRPRPMSDDAIDGDYPTPPPRDQQ